MRIADRVIYFDSARNNSQTEGQTHKFVVYAASVQKTQANHDVHYTLAAYTTRHSPALKLLLGAVSAGQRTSAVAGQLASLKSGQTLA
jgi:hypothetical protein